jgi:peptidoglycan/LPS O-acetylase OafA/YrhL
MTSASTGLHTRRPRLAYLDGIRALAALFVVVHHSYYSIYPPNTPAGAAAPGFLRPISWGHLAVAAFLVVSGYSLALGTLRHGGRLPRGTRQFVVRRFWRIVPTYWAALALSILAGLTWLHQTKTGTVWDWAVPVTAKDSIVHALLLHDFFHPSTINYVLWSIALEWHVYFLFPAVLWVCRRFGAVAMVTLTVIVGAAIGLAFRHNQDQGLLAQAHLFGCFGLGVGACLIGNRGGSLSTKRTMVLPWGWVALGAAALTVGASLKISSPRVPDLLFGVTVATLLVAISSGRATRAARALSVRPLVAVGLFSYSLYLLHPLVVQTVWYYGIRHLTLSPLASYAVMVVPTLILAVFAAWVFFHLVEKRFLTASKPAVPEERELVEVEQSGAAATPR